MSLDPQQLGVVTAPADARILVEAGPGCGKTHVACERVAHLLEQDVEPDRILLLSFTRTAVHEMRSRIMASSSLKPEQARQVQIRTLDSFAWRMRTGVTDIGARGSHEAAIRDAHLSLQRALEGENQELDEWVKRFTHVLVDEAQDLVDGRAELVHAFLNGLPPSTGWTVFADPAQAIYGWSSDAEDAAAAVRFIDLVSSLRGAVRRVSLTNVHRTSDPALLELLRRARVLALGAPSGERLEGVRALLLLEADPVPARLDTLPAALAGHPDVANRTLVLFRRRADVLQALSYIRTAGGGCRLRLGGLPHVAAPWIALIANELTLRRGAALRISHAEFLDGWGAVCEGKAIVRGVSAEEAWRLLLGIARSGAYVDLSKVSRGLAMRTAPDEVFTRELGSGGAVIGTIHGSKGREAELVRLHVSEEKGRGMDSLDVSDEEARVLYVAASRAMRQLKVSRAVASRCGYHDGRAWHAARGGLQIEIGRDGDLDACGALLSGDASIIQQRLASYDGQLHAVHAVATSESGWSRVLRLEGDAEIGALTQECVDSIGSLVKARAGRGTPPPVRIAHLTWLDTTTVALSADDPRVERLPHPWRDSRLVLAPVIAGMGYVRKYWKS